MSKQKRTIATVVQYTLLTARPTHRPTHQRVLPQQLHR